MWLGFIRKSRRQSWEIRTQIGAAPRFSLPLQVRPSLSSEGYCLDFSRWFERISHIIEHPFPLPVSLESLQKAHILSPSLGVPTKPVSPQCSALPRWSLLKQERPVGFCPSPGVSHPFVSLEVNKEREAPSLSAPPYTSSVPEHGLKPLLRCILTSLPDFYLWIALRLLTDLPWMGPCSVLLVLPEVWSPQNINRKGRCQRKTVRGWARTSPGFSHFQPEENYILGRTQPHSLY